MYYKPKMYYFQLVFPLHLEVTVGNIHRSLIGESMKHVQKLSVKVVDTLYQFIKWHQEQAGSH